MQTKILIGLVLTLFIIVFTGVYWATEEGRQEAARVRIMGESAERGGELYHSLCITCHGADGDQMPGIVLKDTELGDDVLKKTISRGRAGTIMPAFHVEDGGPLEFHQIADLINFLKNWDDVHIAEEPSDGTAEGPAEEPAEAEALFAANCAPCHGADRMGGLGPPLTPDSLADKSDSDIRETI
ncbi:MAG: cytochrome c, partial [Dehalococcoidales bacterium]